MENKLSDFKDSRSLREASNIVTSVAVLLHVALGQVTAVEGLTDSVVFTDTERKALVKSFDKTLSFMRKAVDAFNSRANHLENDSK